MLELMHLLVAPEWIVALMAMKSPLKWGFVTPRRLIKTFVTALLSLLIASWIGGVIYVFNVFTIIHGNWQAFNVLTVIHGNRRPFNHCSININQFLGIYVNILLYCLYINCFQVEVFGQGAFYSILFYPVVCIYP